MFEHALAAIDDGTLDAKIDFVFMQRERGEGEGSDGFMDLAASRGIDVLARSSQRFRREHDGDFAGHREEYDEQVVELLKSYKPDLCVLAGYLLILSPPLTHAYRFVNLHPALPGGPVGLWQKVIWELIDQRAEETGAMTFLVTDELDRGPQLSYNRVSLRGGAFDALWSAVRDSRAELLQADAGEEHSLFAAIRAAGVRREPYLLVETLKALANGTQSLDGNQGPMDLTESVETALAVS